MRLIEILFLEFLVDMKVLFICWSNAERSQVAEVLFNFYSKKNKAFSAGINVENEKAVGDHPGRIMSELMLGMGRTEISRKRRKQITEAMAKRADLIFVMLWKGKREKRLPEYVRNSKKTTFWKLSPIDLRVYKTFPPYTYKYHAQWVLEIEQHVKDLVKEVG